MASIKAFARRSLARARFGTRGALSFGDIREQDRDLVLARLAHPEREHVEPATARQLLGLIFEARRLACQRNPGIALEPVLFVRRCDLAHPAAHGVADAGQPLEGGIHLEKTIVAHAPSGANCTSTTQKPWSIAFNTA